MVHVLALTILLNQETHTAPLHTFRIDRKQATREALTFLQSARLGAQAEAQLLPWKSEGVLLKDQDAVGRYKGYYLTIQHPTGDVTFDRFTGRIEFASLHRQNDAIDQELSDEECRKFAVNAVHMTGWSGKLFVNPSFIEREKQYPKDAGVVNFKIQPEASGVLYDIDHCFLVSIDSRTGAVIKLINRAPLPPSKDLFSVSQADAEGAAFHRIARFKGAEEFYIEDTTRMTVVSPPPRISEIANAYQDELSRGTGVFAYSVGFSTPCTSGHSHRDPWKVWIDVKNGTAVHAIGACLKDLAGEFPAKPVSKEGWPKVSVPVTVQSGKGTRSAFGMISEERGQIVSNAKTVQLRFPDRYFIAKFDASQNLLQVGSRVGRPTRHLAEALRAVTR